MCRENISHFPNDAYMQKCTIWRLRIQYQAKIICSDNGSSPDRSQAIIWTNVGILLIWPLGTNFSEILLEIPNFSFERWHFERSSGKWRPFCLGLNVLNAFRIGFVVMHTLPLIMLNNLLYIPLLGIAEITQNYHYKDIIMSAVASQITSLTIVYLSVSSGTDQRKHQSSASLVFVAGEFPPQRASNAENIPFDDVIMFMEHLEPVLCQTWLIHGSLIKQGKLCSLQSCPLSDF